MDNNEGAFWLKEGGERILLQDMDEDYFIKTYQVVQKRQLLAVQSLQKNIDREETFKKISRERGIVLIDLDKSGKDTGIVKSFTEMKECIVSLINSFKRKRNQLRRNENSQSKAVLQEI